MHYMVLCEVTSAQNILPATKGVQPNYLEMRHAFCDKKSASSILQPTTDI